MRLAWIIAVLCLLGWVSPAWAVQGDTFEPDQPYEQALTNSLLRSLLNHALDRLEDHVEISGNLNQDEAKGHRGKHLRFKFYPEGKSKSDQHFAAEGWFHSSPESGEHDLYFKFKRLDDRP